MKRIAIDFGSGMTKIYMPGCGVVLMEATCIAVEEYKKNGARAVGIKAYGDRAKALSVSAAPNLQIINPVFEGDIVNENLAASLLKYFLEKIEITPRRAKRTEVLFLLPCGAKADLKAKYKRLAGLCGISSAYFTLTPFAAVLGQNSSIIANTPVLSVDIGHSITNIAALSYDGIIAGLNVNLGGGNIDVHIIDELEENYNFKIGAQTAERLKNTVGSLLADDNKISVVDGTEVTSGAPASVSVNSEQVYNIITAYIDKILEYVNLVISRLPAEVASSIVHGGVYLSGGLLKMDGLALYIYEKLGIPVCVAEEPQLVEVIGAGVILANEELLERFTTIE